MTPQEFPDRGDFAALPPDDIALLCENLKVRKFAPGTYIINAQETSAVLYVVLEGQAVASLFSKDGKEVSFRDINPGEMFGELSVIDGAPRSAFVKARDRVVAGALTADDLERLIDESPAIRRILLVHMSSQIRAMTERMFELRTLLVRERLIREIVRRARQVDAIGDSACLGWLPTHSDMAALIGTHREAITREMSWLRRTKLIMTQGRTVTVPSVARMEEALNVRFA